MERWRQQAQRERERQIRALAAARVREDNLVRRPDGEGADAEPAAGDAPAARAVPDPPPPTPARPGLVGLLSSRDALRRAVVLAEVLSPPVGLQPPRSLPVRASARVDHPPGVRVAHDDHQDRRPWMGRVGDGDR